MGYHDVAVLFGGIINNLKNIFQPFPHIVSKCILQ